MPVRCSNNKQKMTDDVEQNHLFYIYISILLCHFGLIYFFYYFGCNEIPKQAVLFWTTDFQFHSNVMGKCDNMFGRGACLLMITLNVTFGKFTLVKVEVAHKQSTFKEYLYSRVCTNRMLQPGHMEEDQGQQWKIFEKESLDLQHLFFKIPRKKINQRKNIKTELNFPHVALFVFHTLFIGANYLIQNLFQILSIKITIF